MRSLLNKKFLNLTSRSPIPAVKSSTFISNAPKMADNALNAIFNPPPAIVLTISRTANTPLKVRLSLSAFSSVILSFVENL